MSIHTYYTCTSVTLLNPPTFVAVGYGFDELLVREVHGHLGSKGEGAEVVPALLRPLHKQPEGLASVLQVETLQTLVLGLGKAGGREGFLD